MDAEILAAFACFFNLFTTLFLVILWRWARRRLADAQTRLTTLESTLQQTPATTMAPTAAASATVEQTSNPLLGAVPLAVPSPQLPMSPLAAEVRVSPTSAPPSISMATDQPPQEPEPVANLVDLPPFWHNSPLLSWFTRVHVMVQVGMIVLFFGIAFLVKYAADQGWFSLEMRLTAAAGLGVVLSAVGWRVNTWVKQGPQLWPSPHRRWSRHYLPDHLWSLQPLQPDPGSAGFWRFCRPGRGLRVDGRAQRRLDFGFPGCGRCLPRSHPGQRRRW